MNPFKILMFYSAFFLFNACGGTNAPSNLFEITLEGNTAEFAQNQHIGIHLKNKKGKTIEKVTYSIDGKELPMTGNTLTLNIPHLGNKVLKAQITYENTLVEVTKDIKVLADNPPKIYTYKIINQYPHDTQAYTEGLEFYNDTLYESTGKKGKSSLRKLDYKTGAILKKIDLADTYFGEGITILNNKIYQLTWLSGVGFMYDLKSFEKLDSFKFNQSKEGWGLCNDGKKIFKSDGTEKIWLLDPKTGAEKGYIETVTDKSIFNRANELEYVDGKIYANVYQKQSMMIIDAQSGAITGVINFGGLKNLIKKGADWDEANSVLNGVAYNPVRKTFFVTGKNWDKLFEVQIIEK